MPIYEYRCNSCKKRVSLLIRRITNPPMPVCSHCGSREMTRLLSRRALPVRDPGSGSRTGTTYLNCTPGTREVGAALGPRLAMLVPWLVTLPTNLGRK